MCTWSVLVLLCCLSRQNIVVCMKKQCKKLVESNRGFTLAETLLAVLILLLVSTIVATGIPAARNAYEKVVLASNAEVLLSTSISSLRNELGTAKILSTDSNNKYIVYENNVRGVPTRVFLAPVDLLRAGSPNTIWIKPEVGTLTPNTEPIRLVSKEASTGDLYVTYEKVVFSNGIVTFTNLGVKRESSNEWLTKRDSFSVRILY